MITHINVCRLIGIVRVITACYLTHLWFFPKELLSLSLLTFLSTRCMSSKIIIQNTKMLLGTRSLKKKKDTQSVIVRIEMRTLFKYWSN